ncbi:MAG: metalloregulator ArsR/SmtB family transcription factor [Myxococcales bacterium]|nr:metalloregulator ArsR/SmtB family transcription factor [Myxococcales bacterium]
MTIPEPQLSRYHHPVSVDALQRAFKTFLDPTRVRILALLEREELAVQELMDVLGMAQSRVSRHLAILREVGLLADRRDGTFVFYRFTPPQDAPWRDTWALVSKNLTNDPHRERDATALERVLQSRAARSRSFFDSVGPEWDALRKVFNDEALRAHAVARLVSPRLRVLDVGTGTGILAIELARLGLEVVAIDHSSRMLDAARAKIEAAGDLSVNLRRGEASELPLVDGEVNAAFAHMVVQYLPSPGEAIREMARVVAPGGTVVIVDFLRHTHEWMREELGVTWLGFEPQEIESWFDEAGLGEFRLEVHQGLSQNRDLPATFIASAWTPE